MLKFQKKYCISFSEDQFCHSADSTVCESKGLGVPMASLQRVKGQFCMSFLICRFFSKRLAQHLPVAGTGSIDFIFL